MDNQICQFCGREFIWGRKRKYCSDDCCYDAQLDKRKDLRQAKQQIKKCIYCGREFISRSKDHVCCGDDWCKKARKRKAYKPKSHEERRLKSVTCICVGCGIEFRPVSKQYDKYHSRECFFEHLKAKSKPDKVKPVYVHVCTICGKEFTSERKGRKYCGDECIKENARRIYFEYKNSEKYADDLIKKKSEYKPKEKYTKICVDCGQEYFTNRYNQVCCVDCIDEHQSSNRKMHKGGVSKAKRSRVYNRDGFKCKLCGKKLRMDKADTVWTGKPHPLAPTVDHIIPKSIAKELGWSKQEMNAESNLQAAHFSCNIKKGNKVNSTGEQLLLFG